MRPGFRGAWSREPDAQGRGWRFDSSVAGPLTSVPSSHPIDKEVTVKLTNTYLPLGLAAALVAVIASLSLQRTPSHPQSVFVGHESVSPRAAPATPPTAQAAGSAPASIMTERAARATSLRVDPLSPALRDAVAQAQASRAEADRLLVSAGGQPPDVMPSTAPTPLSTRLAGLRERFELVGMSLER